MKKWSYKKEPIDMSGYSWEKLKSAHRKNAEKLGLKFGNFGWVGTKDSILSKTDKGYFGTTYIGPGKYKHDFEPYDEVRQNPPFYAHNLYEKKTHGLNLKQMRRLYRMVSAGNQKAITYARNVLGIPFSESPSQVKAVVLHHVRDLAERKVRRNPRGYSNIEKSAFEKGAYVGYSPKGVYKIRKMVGKGGWRAMGDISLSFPPRVVTKMLYARDLAEMSKRLQENPLTEDERYHLGRISRDPYLRRHFTGFKRKGKKTRKRVRRNTPKHYHPHFKELKKAGFYDVLHNIEYGGDPMDVPLEKWIKAKRLVEKFPYGSTLRPLIEQRVRYVTRKSYERDFAEAQARKDARA